MNESRIVADFNADPTDPAARLSLSTWAFRNETFPSGIWNRHAAAGAIFEYHHRILPPEDFRTRMSLREGYDGSSWGHQMFNALTYDLPVEDMDATLSIQASRTHYSAPREIVPLYDYTRFEAAVIVHGSFVVTSKYDWSEDGGEVIINPLCREGHILEGLPQWDGPQHDDVYAYISVDHVQAIHDFFRAREIPWLKGLDLFHAKDRASRILWREGVPRIE
jgi:hypothetical protein